MATIHIQHDTAKSADEIATWLDDNLEKTLKYKVKQDKFTLTWDEAHRILTVKGRMVKGSMAVSENRLICDISIPLLLRPFSSTIKLAVKDTLKQL
ncbi:polyhydroxyalkanoic acid system family protein [bacterium]|nr:polyhydroxyalkanoic acid system family protein [bacterium]